MVVLVLFLVLAVGIRAALVGKPFEPTPSLARVRWILTALASIAGGMLVFAVLQDWWVVDDYLHDRIVTTDGSSGFVLTIVLVGLLAAVATVARLWGRRNWVPLALVATWLLVGAAWAFGASGESIDFESDGEALLGLELATWASLVITVTAVLGSVARIAEHRAEHRADAV